MVIAHAGSPRRLFDITFDTLFDINRPVFQRCLGAFALAHSSLSVPAPSQATYLRLNPACALWVQEWLTVRCAGVLSGLDTFRLGVLASLD
jgi:hypothetical protein